ncbi:MAG: penicillin-binding transpeptidase domain-containing protein [Chloroherpetonaceae bacterium]|nr:penicillin-binding transpeptidase domain-containing protein [Chloroherpetonaceae bacterium]
MAHTEKSEKALQQKEEKIRLMLVFGGMALLALGVIVRLIWVQILNAAEYRERAQRQYEFKATIPALRGSILDRYGRRLASSITTVSFAADPKLLEDKDSVAAAFARVFGKPKEYYLKKLSEQTRFVWLERNQPPSKVEALLTLSDAGLIVRKDVHRRYENLASHVIGFVDADNRGISGLEKQLDEWLRGKDGFLTMQRTARGTAFPAVGAPHSDAIAGYDVELTIDADVQAIVEDELQHGVARSGASAGIAIVMNVHTGEILALANVPDFDMNQKTTYHPEATRNRAVTDAFEPGSTFKLVVLAAAVQHQLVKPDERIYAENGRYRIQNRVITDHEKLGTVTFRQAIAHSSNIVAAKTALKLGKEKFYATAKAFGFGEKTGIDLLGEVSGRLKPVQEWSGLSLPWMAHGYEVMVTPIQLITAYAAVANGGELMKPFVVRRILREGNVVETFSPVVRRRVLSSEVAQELRQYLKAVVDSGTGRAARIEGIAVAGKTGTAQQLESGNYRTGRYVASFVGFFPAEAPEFAVLVMMINPTNGYYGGIAAAPVFSSIGGRMLSTLGETYRDKLARVLPPSREQIFLDTVQSVIVPNVCGLSAEEAKAFLRLHKLDFRRDNALHDPVQQVVLQQGIEAGKRVPIWTKVPLTFSEIAHHESAHHSKRMPMLIGLRADRALFEASRLGLRLELEGKSGKVVAQSPKAGERITDGEVCTLILN